MPAPNRTLFGRFFVYSSSLISGTTYQFSLSSDGASKWQVSVDLAKNSSEALAGRLDWNDVQVDAGDEDSGTRLYGWLPEKTLTGVICLSQAFMDDNSLTLPPPGAEAPAATGITTPIAMDYEFQSAIYWKNVPDARAGKRFYGFFARLQTTSPGNDGKPEQSVEFYHAGTSQGGVFVTPATTEWVKLGEIGNFDATAAAGGLTEIEADGDEGKLFISAEYNSIALELVQKLPRELVLLGKKPCKLGKLDVQFY